MTDYKLSDTTGWVKRYKFGNQTAGEKLKIVSDLIHQMVQHGKRDRKVREVAFTVLKQENVKAKDHVNEIRALQKWVQQNIRYTFDIHGVETLHTPRRILIDRVGDCDDSAMLLSSLLSSIGYETGVMLVDAKGDGRISHAMAAVKLPRPKGSQPKGWIPLETTKEVPMGWHPKNITRKILIKIKRKYNI